MVDVRKSATLRGFHASVADVGDQMHLCHPLLSFEGDRALYLADHLDWRNEPEALAVADPNEASALGTLLPSANARPIASGEGLVAVGVAFVQAAATAQVQLLESEVRFERVDEPECWIGLATPALYTTLRTRLVEEARAVFDEALKDAACRGSHLFENGNAALLIMRKCGSLRSDDLAIRRLAAARQNGELDLYRRLLIRFSVELDAPEHILDERAQRHIAVVRQTALSPHIDSLFDSPSDLLHKIASLDVDRIEEDAYWKIVEGIGAASNRYYYPNWQALEVRTGGKLVMETTPSGEVFFRVPVHGQSLADEAVWREESVANPVKIDVRNQKSIPKSSVEKGIWVSWAEIPTVSQQRKTVADQRELV